MKKKVIAVIMTALIVMSMAACGGKDTDADADVKESVTESTVTEESPAQDEGAEAEDQASVGNTESDGEVSEEASEPVTEESAVGEEADPSSETEADPAEGSEAADASAETEGVDWDSVDWDAPCLTTTTGKQMKTWGLIEMASYAKFRGFTQEEVVAYRFSTDEEEVLAEEGTATYDDLTEEGKFLLDELFKLSMDEVTALMEKYCTYE